jgi:hypothetical protein
VSVGMPQTLLLQEFGEHVHRAFGHVCYQVGSSLKEKSGWRDVDVRLMLPDDEYARMKLGDPAHPQRNKRWVSLVLVWSSFGRQLTGLPIDFQIQQTSYANEKFSRDSGGLRSALFRLCDCIEVAESRQEQEESSK